MKSKRIVIPDGDELRRRRISKGLTQAQLGEKAGVAETSVRNIGAEGHARGIRWR